MVRERKGEGHFRRKGKNFDGCGASVGSIELLADLLVSTILRRKKKWLSEKESESE